MAKLIRVLSCVILFVTPLVAEPEKDTAAEKSSVEPASESLFTSEGLSPLRLVAVTGIIAGLIYLTAYGMRRYMGRSRGTAAGSTSMEVLETLPLGNRRFLLITRVGERVILLGAGDQGINMITELQDWRKGALESRERFKDLVGRYAGDDDESEEMSAADVGKRRPVEALI